MKLIVGLGNPGPEYEFTPHNLGFAVVDRLAERHSIRLARKQYQSLCGCVRIGDEDAWLIKPQTFMNLSGVAVKEWLAKQDCGPEELLVIADEIDLPWGNIRIRAKGGSAGHHGLESIIAAIASRQFARLRIGVSPEHPITDTVHYLLSPVRRVQRRELEEILDRACDAAETVVKQGPEKAMNLFNRKAATKSSEK